MRFEHHSEKLATLPHFLLRSTRYGFSAMILIAASVAVGSIGYHLVADLPWIDSFHMACMILTGMGPVVEMHSFGAKLFSSLYALYSGVAFLTLSAFLLAPLIHRLFHILHLEGQENNERK